jgi:hypothetical protein
VGGGRLNLVALGLAALALALIVERVT